MRMSDIMSHMDLAMFPKVALVIFLGVFIAVTLKVYLSKSAYFDRCAAIPLDDTVVQTPRTEAVEEEGGQIHG